MINLVVSAVASQALEAIRYPWRRHLPGWNLVFLGPRPGYLARTLWPDRVIEVYLRRGQDTNDVAFALAHELGHAIDLEHLDPGLRACWKAARRLAPDLAWFGPSDEEDFDTPAGDWAECFASWQVGSDASFRSRLGGPPSMAQIDVMRRLADTGSFSPFLA